jgi:muramoyltetrapeptide carboxypeptidase
MRILDALDYAALRRDPKCIVGYSDMTAPLNAFAQRCNVVTYHATMPGVPMSENALERLRAALFDGRFEPLPHDVRGTLRGGNLSLVAALCGTPYAIDFADAVVLLEDIDEAPYRIDRLLTQLLLAGAFTSAAAFAIGDIPAREVVDERLRPLGVPIVDVNAGHIAEQSPFAIGARG